MHFVLTRHGIATFVHVLLNDHFFDGSNQRWSQDCCGEGFRDSDLIQSVQKKSASHTASLCSVFIGPDMDFSFH